MKIAILQINPIVGDLDGNAAKIKRFANKAKRADLIVTSELALLGYPPRDLLLYPEFIKSSWSVLEKIAKETKLLPPILVGTAVINKNRSGRPLCNVACLIYKGRVQKIFFKSLLPTYDVFDEDRYFEPTDKPQILTLKGKKIGASICEDLWNDRDFWQRPRYHFDPIEKLAKERVQLIINLSASPFTIDKQKSRETMIAASAKKYKVPIIYVNQVGANDDLIFDGASTVFNQKGELIVRAKAFEEDLLVVSLGSDPRKDPRKPHYNNLNSGPTLIRPYPKIAEELIFDAISLGLRDYLSKCGFQKVLIGLSGGIDSSVVATIAAHALGAKNVTGVLMPSPFTSKSSITDAQNLAKNLKIKTIRIDITSLMHLYDRLLASAFSGYKKDTTEENIQSRIRGNILMALSNKYKALLLTTGNKSELTVGYTTIYGDLSGGLAPIGDLWKTQVYALAKWLNRKNKIIPQEVLKKAPSAELAPNQRDQDTLPPYDLLDKVLKLHIENHLSEEEIVKRGFKKALVARIINMVRKTEYKRRQAPPTLKVSERAYGIGWRMPIATSIS